ncbi:hypothetical protein OG417_10140 [Actinoallomurus sp. NBC_01490]|uniref:hypothetical protein n=1 Tax=Actinoallomurus sp. NBC_01490 TaxID=2903557 RepID=UPI002E2FF15F|nr:hypothetical protein [Actinoallomurus sp. NBC_01490]
MSPARERRRPRPSTVNTASDNARIGIQGTVIGDVRYEIKDGDPPEKKFAVAKRCLAGKMPPQARRLIEEAVQEALVTPESTRSLVNEVAYYWTIAVLSDQPFEVLEREEFAALDRARWLCQKGPADSWRDAHRAVTGLIACLQGQEQTGTFDSGALDAFLSAFDRLPDDRRREIYRHLDPILSNVLRDRREADLLDIARRQRTADDREERVWKFFEPDPEPPRPKPLRRPDFGPFEQAAAVCGAALVAGGLALAFTLVTLGSADTAVITGGVVLAGTWILLLWGPGQLPGRYSALYPRRPRPAPTDFSAHVERTVRQQFDKHAPTSAAQRSRWAVATMRARTLLAQDIVDRYADPEVSPGAVDWLIAWYAENTARRWTAREPEDPDRLLRLSMLAVGLGTFVGGWYYALDEMTKVQKTVATVAVLWLVAGAVLLARSRADVYVARRHSVAADQAEADRILEEETFAHEERVELLADRPDDDEMAQWLDYDKIYLKTLAMNQYGLTNRDLITHAVLPEGTETARRSRVKGGQPRFSAYVVWVFLLTVSGVRQVKMHLDFPTGVASDQQRTAFRYDAIASAQVEEVGIRFDDGHREVVLPRTDEEKDRIRQSAVPIYQEFRLELVNRHTIGITVDTFNAVLLEQLLEEQQAPPSPDLADLTGALSLLETVAADGRKWLEQTRIRRGYKPLDTEPDFPATA